MEHYEEYTANFDMGEVVHFEYTPEGLPPVVLEAVPVDNIGLGLLYEDFDDSDEFVPEGPHPPTISEGTRAEAEKDKREWLIEEKKEVELLSREEMKEFVKGTKNVNTVRKTGQIVVAFQKYLSEVCFEERPIHTIMPDELDNFLANYILNKRDVKGNEHQPDTLTGIHRGILRHLKEMDYECDPLHDDEFRMSREVLQAKRSTLKKQGLGNKPNRAEGFDDRQIELLWESGALGASTPEILQYTVYYFLNVGFGLRGSHEARQMLWGDVELKADDDGGLFLEFNERASKTRTGGEGGHVRSFAPKVYQVQDEKRCPIYYYKKFAERRPEAAMTAESPLYLTVKQGAKMTDTVGFTKAPMGVNMLRSIVKKMAAKAGLQGRHTNHSLRKTSCQMLMAANVPPVLVAQLSGHKALSSLNNYTEATRLQQKAMSNILTGQKRPSSVLQCEESPMSENTPLYQVPSPSTLGLLSSAPATNSNMAGQPGPPPATIQRMSDSAQGMFQGAVIHGNINLQIHYNVANNSQANLSMSPVIPRPAVD